MITIIALFVRRVSERGTVSDVISADRGQGRQLGPSLPKRGSPISCGDSRTHSHLSLHPSAPLAWAPLAW